MVSKSETVKMLRKKGLTEPEIREEIGLCLECGADPEVWVELFKDKHSCKRRE